VDFCPSLYFEPQYHQFPGFHTSFFALAYTCSSAIAETALQSGLFWPKVEDWNWETISCGHYTSIFNHGDVIGQQGDRIWWKKHATTPFKVIQSFKVIEVGTNRKPVCDFLLVINTNW